MFILNLTSENEPPLGEVKKPTRVVYVQTLNANGKNADNVDEYVLTEECADGSAPSRGLALHESILDAAVAWHAANKKFIVRKKGNVSLTFYSH